MKPWHVVALVGGLVVVGGAVFLASRPSVPYMGAAGLGTGNTAGDLISRFGGSFLSKLGDTLGSRLGSIGSGSGSSASLGAGTDGYTFTDDSGDFVAG